MKELGAKASHVEHVAKQWVADKCSLGYDKLPGPLKPIARGAFAIGKLGTAAAFATYSAGQSMVEQVCKERGMSPEEARRIRGVCATCDILAAKPIMLGLEFTPGGHALMGPMGLTPVASTGYLLYSTAVNPAATIRAAGKLVSRTAGKLAGKLTGRSMETRDGDGSDTVNAIADAISAHDGSDWYIAILSSALDMTQDVSAAITVADAAYEEKSEDDSDKAE